MARGDAPIRPGSEQRELIAHLGTLDFVTARDNVLLLGPPGTGKTHLATGLAIRNAVRQQVWPLRSVTIVINGAIQTYPPAISAER